MSVVFTSFFRGSSAGCFINAAVYLLWLLGPKAAATWALVGAAFFAWASIKGEA